MPDLSKLVRYAVSFAIFVLVLYGLEAVLEELFVEELPLLDEEDGVEYEGVAVVLVLGAV